MLLLALLAHSRPDAWTCCGPTWSCCFGALCSDFNTAVSLLLLAISRDCCCGALPSFVGGAIWSLRVPAAGCAPHTAAHLYIVVNDRVAGARQRASPATVSAVNPDQEAFSLSIQRGGLAQQMTCIGCSAASSKFDRRLQLRSCRADHLVSDDHFAIVIPVCNTVTLLTRRADASVATQPC
jgi:hypothetical protein